MVLVSCFGVMFCFLVVIIYSVRIGSIVLFIVIDMFMVDRLMLLNSCCMLRMELIVILVILILFCMWGWLEL